MTERSEVIELSAGYTNVNINKQTPSSGLVTGDSLVLHVITRHAANE